MTDWPFMTDHAAVVPFSPGTVVYVDGMLSTVYYKLKEAGRLELTFCGDKPNHDQFIRIFDELKKVSQILCEVTDAFTEREKVHPVGISWVEMPKGEDGSRAAMCGFAFFKRSRYMRDMARMGIAYWLKMLKIDVIHGVMLASNREAIHFASKLGFEPAAEVPYFHSYRGELVPAKAMMLRAKLFLPAYEEWYEKQVKNPVE